MAEYRYDQLGVGADLELGKGGGRIVWNVDHFEATVDGSTLTVMQVGAAVGINDAASRSYIDSLTVAYDIALFIEETPTDAQIVAEFTAVRDFEFPADFVGSDGKILTNPTALFDIDVQVDTTTIGTISISTGGVFTFTTVGGTLKTILTGEVLSFVAPGTADATAAGVSFTLLGTIGGTGSTGAAFSGARIYADTARTYDATIIAVIYDVVDFDVGGFADLGSNDTRLTVPADGYYEFTAQARRDDTDDPDLLGIAFRLNGVAVDISKFQFIPDPNSTVENYIQVTTGPILLSKDDYVEVFLRWNPSEDSIADNAFSMWFSVRALTAASGGGGSADLGGLSDVDLAATAPRTNDRLAYNGTEWVPVGSSFCILAGKSESFTHNQSKVSVWTEVEDSDNYFGGGVVADEQWVFPFTGRYRITCKIQLDNATTTDFLFQIVARKNRGGNQTFFNDFTDFRYEDRRTSVSISIKRTQNVIGLVDVVAGDEMDILFYHFGATRNFHTDSFVHIEYVGQTPV